jgi:hypothetical protein
LLARKLRLFNRRQVYRIVKGFAPRRRAFNTQWLQCRSMATRWRAGLGLGFHKHGHPTDAWPEGL